MSPRVYEQRVRAESAAQTRQQILNAAYDRLRAEPADRVTVDGVARDAGVSRATVYLVFGGRNGLFDAIGADLLQRSGFDEVLRAVEDPDAHAALQRFLHATAQMYACNRDVLRSLFAMAHVDPTAVGGAIGRMEQGRARGMQLLAQRLAEAGLLRHGVHTYDAADLLWLVSSFDGFDLLYTGRDRSPDQIAAAFLTIVERSLLP